MAQIDISPKRTIIAAASAIGALFLIVFVMFLFKNNDAKDYLVIQAPLSGELAIHTDGGWKWQGMGKATTYHRRDQFSFSNKVDQGKAQDESISTRFNDGGHGNISGTVNWQMPASEELIVK